MQVPGVIVMQLTSAEALGFEGGTHDAKYKRILVIFNALPYDYEQQLPDGKILC